MTPTHRLVFISTICYTGLAVWSSLIISSCYLLVTVNMNSFLFWSLGIITKVHFTLEIAAAEYSGVDYYTSPFTLFV